MKLPDLSAAEELQPIKLQYEQAGIEFEPVLKEAYMQLKEVQMISTPNRQQIISFILNVLQSELEKRMSQPAKTKAGKIVRLFWGAAKFLGLVGKAKQAVLKEAGKL